MVNREKLINLLSKSDCSLKQRVVCAVLCVLYLYFLHQHRDLYYQEEIMISLYSGSGVKSSLNVKQTFYGQAWECHFFFFFNIVQHTILEGSSCKLRGQN